MVSPTRKTSNKERLYALPLQKENFGLSKAEFLTYVTNLQEGDDSFITDIMLTQLPKSMSYLQNNYSISRSQAYDVCMTTLISFRHKLISEKITYGNLRFLFTRMCANHFIDGHKRKARTEEAIKIFLDANSDQVDKEEFFTRLEESISQLDSQQQLLLKEIYCSGKSMAEIADEYKLTYANMRKKKERILGKLRVIYFQKGVI